MERRAAFLIDTMNRRDHEKNRRAGIFDLARAMPRLQRARLQPESLAVKVDGRSIADYTALPIVESVRAFTEVDLTPREEIIAGLILQEIRHR